MGDVISTLHDVDPAFRDLVGLLYKAGPGPDGSELHAPGGGSHPPRRGRAKQPPPAGRLVPVSKALNPIRTLSDVADLGAQLRRTAALQQNAATTGRSPGQLLRTAAKADRRVARNAKLGRARAGITARGQQARAGIAEGGRQARAGIAEGAQDVGQRLVRNVKTALAEPPRKTGPRPGRLLATGAVAGAAGAGAAVHQSNKNRMTKSADETTSVTWTGVISKVDDDRRQCFGFCSVSEVNGQPVVDLQGDWVPIEEVEKAAYSYMLTSRAGGDMHKRVAKYAADEPLRTAEIIESFVVTPEKLDVLGVPEHSVPLGWWLGFQVHDGDAWAAIKSGRRTGFSLHGTGKRREVEL